MQQRIVVCTPNSAFLASMCWEQKKKLFNNHIQNHNYSRRLFRFQSVNLALGASLLFHWNSQTKKNVIYAYRHARVSVI